MGYTSPPGVFNSADRAGANLEFGSQQVNEKSLRLLARDLRLGERAEAFERFTMGLESEAGGAVLTLSWDTRTYAVPITVR